MKKVVMWILEIPYFILKLILKFIKWLLKMLFGWLFGWIPDFDERMSGEEFEAYVQEILKRNGYKHVELTKRSGDYGIDILAEYKGDSYAIQCKKYAKPVGVAAVQQAYSGCQYYECDYAVVVTNQRFTAQAITLAENNQVALWDGQYLNHLKKKANRRRFFQRTKEQEKKTQKSHSSYQLVLEVLLNAGYGSVALLVEHLHYSEQKAYYILEDLEYHDLVSKEDHLGIRDLYFLTLEEAIGQLEN